MVRYYCLEQRLLFDSSTTATLGTLDFSGFSGISTLVNTTANGAYYTDLVGKSTSNVGAGFTFEALGSTGKITSNTGQILLWATSDGLTAQQYGMKDQSQNNFKLTSFDIKQGAAAWNPNGFTVTGYNNGVVVAGASLNFSIPMDGVFHTIDLSSISAFGSIDEFRISNSNVMTSGTNGTVYLDNIVVAAQATSGATAPTTTVLSASLSADSGTSASDFVTNTAAQTISGTLSANLANGESVEVSYDGGATWSNATSFTVGSNTWSTTTTLSGSNTFEARVTNSGGSSTAYTHTYSLDTSSPAAPGTPDMTSGTDSGASNTDNITSDTTPIFSGTATANSIVTLYDTNGTTVLGTTTSDGSGNWSITSSTLSSGTHTITAKVTDTAGNESVASAGLSITVDTASPSAIALSSNTLSNSASTNTAVGTLSSTDATVGDTFTYSLVAGAGSTDNASFSISGNSLVATNPSALSAGSYSVRVRTTDVAGNYFEQTFSITVTSNLAPVVSTPTAIALTDTSSTDTFSNQTGTLSATDADGIASYGIQGGATGGSNVVGAITYDVSKLGTYGTLYVKSSDGSYVYVPNASAINGRLANTSETFTVTATDNNASAATGTATLTVNITGVNDLPTDISLTATSVSQSGGSNATVGTLSTTDADTGDTHTHTLVSGTGDTNNGLFNISGTSLRATNAGSMTPGTYTVRVQTTDAASATYAEAMTITVVDDVAPTVASVSVPANAWYVAGQNLDFTVNFSESVTVVTTGGTPRIALTVGTTTVYADYVSGSGTSALVFRYTVQANDLDTNGITVGNLSLNGGTLADAAGNNAVLTLNSVGSTSAVLVDAVTPSASSTPDLALASDSGTSGTDNITSDTTPTFTGTAEANSTVTLYDSDGTTVLGTATADGAGAWTITSSTLASGSHNITVKITDAAGNTSAASSPLAITVDATAPSAVTLSTTSVADTAATNGSTVATLSGTDTTALTYALVAGSGDTHNGSFTISGGNLQAAANLAAGTYNIRVQATDAAGNTTEQTFTITVTAGPSVSSINRAAGSALTNATSVDFTVTFNESVTGVDASDFALTTTGTAAGTIASITGNGTTYTVTVNGLSGDGTLRLDLDNSGTGIVNAGTQAITGGYTSGQTYTLDTSSPTAPTGLDLDAGSDSGTSTTDNVTSDNTPTVSGAGAEPGSTVTLYDTAGTTVLGTTTADGAGAWTITASALSDGVHTLTAKVTDDAGNTGAASTPLSVTIDTTAPSAPGAIDLDSGSDTGISNSDNVTSDTTPTFNGTAEVNSTVTLYDTDGTTVLGTTTADSSGNWSITASTLAGGSHTLTVKAKDAAGNESGASSSLSVTIDTTAPNAPTGLDVLASSDSGTSNTDNITSNNTPTVSGAGAEPGSTVTLYDSNGTTVLGTTTADSSGNWSVTTSALADGTHTLTAKVTDTAGNVGAASSSLTVTIDSTAPGASGTPVLASGSDSGASNADNITSDTTPTITGSGAEAGATVTLYDTDGTTVLGTATADGSGNWSITSSTLSEGAHTLKTKVTDTAGNTSVASASLAITVDTTAPTVITLSANSVMDVATGTNTAVATLSSTDTQSVTYTLEAGNGTNDAGNASFVIAGGVLQSRSQLTAGTYNIRVGATDAAGNISYQTFVITVNTNTAPTITSGATASVAENAAISTVVYTATATDVDAGQTLSYSLSGTDAGSFDINASTGVVTLKASANYEAKASYSFNVVATDNGTGTLTDTKEVTVTVTDVNDPTTGLLAVAGEARQGQTLTVIDTLADQDGISGKTYQWLADGVPIQGATQASYLLELAQAGKQISVQVRYTDSGNRIETLTSVSTSAVIGLAPVVSPSEVVVPAVVSSALPAVEPSVMMSAIPVNLVNVPVAAPVFLTFERDVRPDVAADARTLQGFSVPVVNRGSTSLPEVLVLRDMADQSATRVGNQLIVNFDVPATTFAHTDPSASVTLSAALADGRPLPGWLKFNPITGEFRGIAPENYEGSLEITVVATDNNGSKAVTRFKVDLTGKSDKTSDAGKPRLQAEMMSQSSFAWKAERDAWIRHAREASKVNRTAAAT